MIWAMRVVLGWLACDKGHGMCLPTRAILFQLDYRKVLISFLHLPECSFHVRYKWVVANVSMKCDKL